MWSQVSAYYGLPLRGTVHNSSLNYKLCKCTESGHKSAQIVRLLSLIVTFCINITAWNGLGLQVENVFPYDAADLRKLA